MLGKRVRELRKERGLSLSELAEAAGIAKSYLSTIERDIHSNPSVHLLAKIAGILEVSLEELVYPQARKTDSLAKQAWYELFIEALDSGISREELRSMIAVRKQHKSRNAK